MSGFERIVLAATRRPGRTLVAAAALALACAAAALALLSPSAGTRTLVGGSTPEQRATERHREAFGDHAIVVLVRGSLPDLVLTENLGRLLGLEGCLSGNQPAGKEAAGGPASPCAELARTKPVQVVYGPATFINAAVGEIQDEFRARSEAKAAEARRAGRAARGLAAAQGKPASEQRRLARAAEQVVYAGFVRDLLTLNARYGLGTRLPRLNDPAFVASLVFDPARGAGVPKARFAYLFPNRRSAVIQVRLKPALGDAERRRAIELVRSAVTMPEWRLDRGATYTVTGEPVLVEDLTDALSGSLLRLLAVGLVVMAAVLLAVFRSRLRLAPLAVALGAVAVTFGLMGLVGAPLTMASIAVLPVLLGLGIDYAIQFQARVEEAEQDADTATAAARAARTAVPTIAVAAAATIAGLLALALSPVPMVRWFGVLVAVGIVVALAMALTAGAAALVLTRPRPRTGPLARSARGAAELLDAAARPLARAGGRAAGFSLRRPWPVLAAALALAAGGWALESRGEVASDLRELVGGDLAAVQALGVLEQTTGVAGEIDVLVRGGDLTDPAVVAWMRDYQARVLGRSGGRGCGEAALCPALSLPDLFRSEAAAGSRAQIRALLDAVPPYFSQAVITSDRRVATLAFGIRLMSLEEQQRVIERMRAELDPPAGVRAELAGLPVLAAEASAALSSPVRRLGTLVAGLGAVALVLLVALRRDPRWRFGGRRWARAWAPLAPIALATGWSALVLFLLGVPLNPMSATLGVLVIAISTEFSVLLTARFGEERLRGHAPAVALARAWRSTGAAVAASGATAIGGFAVLALSDVRMLRDFGLVTVVDLGVSLLGVLLVLPATLALAERRARPVAPPPAPAAAPAVHA